MFYPYPGDVPSKEILAIVVDALRGRPYDVKEAVHAAWHVAGYGLSKWDIHDVVYGSGPEATPENNEAAAVALEAMMTGVAGDETKVIPWMIIIPIVIQLILRFVK